MIDAKNRVFQHYLRIAVGTASRSPAVSIIARLAAARQPEDHIAVGTRPARARAQRFTTAGLSCRSQPPHLCELACQRPCRMVRKVARIGGWPALARSRFSPRAVLPGAGLAADRLDRGDQRCRAGARFPVVDFRAASCRLPRLSHNWLRQTRQRWCGNDCTAHVSATIDISSRAPRRRRWRSMRSASSAASLAPVALPPPREPDIPQRRQHEAAQSHADQPALDKPAPFASVKIASQ